MLAHPYGAALELAAAAGTSDDELARRACTAFRDAGERALNLNAVGAAKHHYEAALALASEADAEYPHLLLGLGLALVDQDQPAAIERLTDAADRLAAVGDAEHAAVAELTAASAYWGSGHRDHADEHSARAVELLADAPVSEAKVEAVSQRARLLMLGGERSRAVELATA